MNQCDINLLLSSWRSLFALKTHLCDKSEKDELDDVFEDVLVACCRSERALLSCLSNGIYKIVVKD